MTLQNKKSGTDLAQSGTEKIRKAGRSQSDYWISRLRKRSYSWEGQTVEIPEWQVRIAYLGRREWFNTDTQNKNVAADKARRIYLNLVSKGWEPTLKEFKPNTQSASKAHTVGDFLVQVKAVSDLKPVTFEIYARKFRTLVAGVFNLHGGKEKYDYVNKGRDKWLQRIHRVRLDKLTPARIHTWKIRYLKDAKNPLEEKHAKTTVNSLIRGSKALFSKRIMKNLPCPIPCPFESVENVKLPKNRYKSQINPHLLLTLAKRELADATQAPIEPGTNRQVAASIRQEPEDKKEMFKILILALGAGLRRDEIDTLTWSQMDWTNNQIRVETTVHTAAKSDESENAVDVDPGLMEIFHGYMATSKSEFVIISAVKPRPMVATYHHYRCNRLFNLLNEWLRTKGISSRNPIHALRKEFGSQICKQAGIFAASEALRHSNIQLTRDYYLDKKAPVVFKIGEALNGPDNQSAAEETPKAAPAAQNHA